MKSELSQRSRAVHGTGAGREVANSDVVVPGGRVPRSQSHCRGTDAPITWSDSHYFADGGDAWYAAMRSRRAIEGALDRLTRAELVRTRASGASVPRDVPGDQVLSSSSSRSASCHTHSGIAVARPVQRALTGQRASPRAAAPVVGGRALRDAAQAR